MGKSEWLGDRRVSARAERTTKRRSVEEAVGDALTNMTMEQGIGRFSRHDVVAAPVNTIPMAAEDPHPWERGTMVEVPDFLAGSIAVSGDYWHFSRTPVVVGSTPQVGEHNEEVLSGILGYSVEEIDQMRQANVIGERDRKSVV